MRYVYRGLYSVAIVCFVLALYPVAILLFGSVGMGADVVILAAISLVLGGAASCVLAELLSRLLNGQVNSKGRMVLFAGVLVSPVILMMIYVIAS